MNEFTDKKEWKLTKTVLPQHTDHAGVMWHGSYFHFLEEGRIDALSQVGIKYSRFSKEGYEIPVISAQIKYKTSFKHGEKVLLLSKFKLVNKIRINCKTLFLKSNGKIEKEWNPLGIISNDASTVGAYDLDINSSSEGTNNVLENIQNNSNEILFLFGQDNLNFKKKR